MTLYELLAIVSSVVFSFSAIVISILSYRLSKNAHRASIKNEYEQGRPKLTLEHCYLTPNDIDLVANQLKSYDVPNSRQMTLEELDLLKKTKSHVGFQSINRENYFFINLISPSLLCENVLLVLNYATLHIKNYGCYVSNFKVVFASMTLKNGDIVILEGGINELSKGIDTGETIQVKLAQAVVLSDNECFALNALRDLDQIDFFDDSVAGEICNALNYDNLLIRIKAININNSAYYYDFIFKNNGAKFSRQVDYLTPKKE